MLYEKNFSSDQLILIFYNLIGKFGRLFHCSFNDPSTNLSTQNIYGKTVNSSAASVQLNQMLHDCCLFATLKHSNINSPLGIVYKNELSPYPLIVYPYSNKGILKRFIIQNRTIAREQVCISTIVVNFYYNIYFISVIINTRAGLYGNTHRQRFTFFT